VERLKERIQIAEKALLTLSNLLARGQLNDIERDAAIQRFEYSFEAVWKAVKRYLYVVEGIEANSPKAVIRASHDSKLLTVEHAKWAMVMVDDRNMTSHTYNESLAIELVTRLKEHLVVLTSWLTSIKKSNGQSI
jgi:nucleotidyltransferase substrate binding protein (TIGR01987 family)